LTRKVKPQALADTTTEKAPSNLSSMPIEVADIVISPTEIDESLKTESVSIELYPKVESLLRAIPSIATSIASSGKLFKITFSPQVTKALSDGSYSLMQSGKGFKAIAVDRAGKIIEQGHISPDHFASTVASVGAVWQILAIVTAQKFLSDINKKLAGIEDSLKGLETWLDTQEQGRFLGSYKYLAEVVATSAKSPNTADFLVIKTQTERIYHDSLQAIAANKLRAEAAAEELLRKKFDGNLIENTNKFRELMDSYFSAASYAIRFNIVAALSEYLSAYVDRNPEQESKRIEAIVKEAEEFIRKIQSDSKKMKEKASQISGGWWDSDEEVIEGRSNLNGEMELLLSSCENALARIRAIHDETNKIGLHSKELGEHGLSLLIETNSSGKLIGAKSLKG